MQMQLAKACGKRAAPFAVECILRSEWPRPYTRDAKGFTSFCWERETGHPRIGSLNQGHMAVGDEVNRMKRKAFRTPLAALVLCKCNEMEFLARR